jgi:membrane protein implicated in regulation of membrane protease activity
VAINASPEPVSNWVASGTEDAVAVGGLTLTLLAPVLAAALLLVFTAGGLYLGWRLVRGFSKRQENKTRTASQV